MSVPALHLTELPPELLEHVCLQLPGRDIIKMEAVSRDFRALVHNSPTLQYRRELFAAGLVDNPSNPCDLVERRKLCKEYARKWSDAAIVVKSTYKLPPNRFPPRRDYVGKNTILSYPTPNSNFDFLYIPPVASRKPISGWSIPPFSFNPLAIGVYHPDNVLGVVEHQEDLLRIHLLNLQDGSPYCDTPSDAITWAIPRGMSHIKCWQLTITGSRVASCLSHPHAALRHRAVWMVLVWDRKTGNLVLDLSTSDWKDFISSGVVFLDEFRIMISARYVGINPPELIVFDTLIPQGCLRSSRRFSLPPQYDHGYYALLHTDQDRYLGTLDRDVPLITDPTQAVLVVEISKPEYGSISLVVRIQALIGHVRSPRTDVHIPWDEWGRGVMILENPQATYRVPIYVHGIHVVVLKMRSGDGPRYDRLAHIFDFGQRRYGLLPLLGWESGGAEKRVMFEDGRELLLEAGVSSWDSGMKSLGDGTFFRSSASGAPDPDMYLHVWELA